MPDRSGKAEGKVQEGCRIASGGCFDCVCLCKAGEIADDQQQQQFHTAQLNQP